MTPGEITILLGIAITLLAGLYGTWRLANSARWHESGQDSARWIDEKKAEEEIERLKEELEIMRLEFATERMSMHAHCEEEKARFITENRRLRNRVAILEALIRGGS